MEDKLYGYTSKEWMFAFLDVLDGNSCWYDIMNFTGWNEERSKELEQMFIAATKNGWPKRDWPKRATK